ncbi:hypothetical protein HAHE_35470 [Haloferula helveola]|uniref:Chromosome partition protein Smc n=1 Tax=Haloferula helveola TaxID=490095 RepID=A0ABM7RD85_9BACT|nr:hypothetical protein HAHE_35470 [Haloferula helveola]
MKALAALALLSVLPGFAAEEMDMEARRESVKTLKTHIEMRQERLDEVVSELRERVGETDKKVGKVVEVLSGLKDSQDSKRRISQIKSEAIGGLKGMIETYDRERRKLLERLRTGAGPATEGLKKDLEKFDALIQKRADDVVKLAKSMPAGEDVAKYESDGGYYFNGVHYENSRISEEWRQNRRDKVQSGKERRELQQALERAIEDLERRRDTVKAFLKDRKFTPAERELREQELARVEGLLEARKAQLVEVATPADAPEKTADQEQAQDLEHLLRDAKQDIASDLSRTLRLYHEAADERDKIAGLEENLAAREKWLEENDKAGE